MGDVRDPAEVSRFIERFAQLLVDGGMPRIASRIFVALLATDTGRLTAGDLAEQLRASPAAISGGVRYLAQVGMLTREREPGSRRDHYRVEDNVWYKMISQRDQLMLRWAANIRDGVEAVGPHSPAGVRLAESVEFLEFLQSEMRDLASRWQSHRAAWASPAAGTHPAPATTRGAAAAAAPPSTVDAQAGTSSIAR